MISILFVDDEPKVLSAIRRSIRSKRPEWDVDFATSGADALDRLADRSRDVLVADWRMPGMDGIELLRLVQERHPEIIRIILTGQPVREKEAESLQFAHQLLTKPCPPEQLVAVLEGLERCVGYIGNRKLMKVLSPTNLLQGQPMVYKQLTAELLQDEPSIPSIAQLIEQDGSLTSRILSIVNSAYFALPGRVAKIDRAVSLLGLTNVQALIMSDSIYSSFDTGRELGISLRSLWEHNMRTAGLAIRLAALDTESASKELVSLGGMLHDIGKLVLSSLFTVEYNEVLSQVRTTDVRIFEAERQQFGVTHAEVGAYLIGLWGMPQDVVRIVASHHVDTSHDPVGDGCDIVFVANTMDHVYHIENKNYWHPGLHEALSRPNASDQQLEQWKTTATAYYDQVLNHE